MPEPGSGTGGLVSSRCFPAAAATGWALVGKPCEYCSSSSALLFCRTDSAFLCIGCDAKVHATGKLGSRHERVWMCEVCEQAPASVTCKADAAALCVTCDHDIHSANPLARRHERVPVVPFYDTAEYVAKSTAASFLVPPPPSSDTNVNPANFSHTSQDAKLGTCLSHEREYYVSDAAAAAAAAAWISSNPKVNSDAQDIKSMEFLLSEPDNYLEFDYPVPSETRNFQHHYSSGTDGVVPVQSVKPQFLPVNHNSSEKHFEIDFTKSNISSYNHTYTASSLSHSVSSSSLDVGVVPDGSSMSDISYPFGQSLSSVDLSAASSGGNNQGSQMGGMDREARVLRYREKRKNRKFEKTIRYASRKAYAETRPRIKGRFAKRTETVESEMDRIFSPHSSTAAFFPESRYGVVPSF